MRLEHKLVTVVANPDVGSRCHVHLLDKYISKLSPEDIEKNLFYCRPLSCTPKEPSQPWYMPVPVGKNTLCKMVSEMCEEAGISGKKTNHSLRVSGASSHFSAGVPERIIQQRTGHRSLEALRLYERVTDDQNLTVSKILCGEKNSFEDSERKVEGVASGVQCSNCTVNVYQGTLPLVPPQDSYMPQSLLSSYVSPYNQP